MKSMKSNSATNGAGSSARKLLQTRRLPLDYYGTRTGVRCMCK